MWVLAVHGAALYCVCTSSALCIADSDHEDAPAPKAARRRVVGADDSDEELPLRRPSSNGPVEVNAALAQGGAQQAPPPGNEGPEREGAKEGLDGRPTLRVLGELESRLLQWQWANAEYGNSACLDKVQNMLLVVVDCGVDRHMLMAVLSHAWLQHLSSSRIMIITCALLSFSLCCTQSILLCLCVCIHTV